MDHDEFKDLKDVLAFYISRITTVVQIETFSYFFFGLYRGNLAEIKYCQNERTRLEAMEIAWRSSTNRDAKGPEIDVIKQLTRTDRNFATKELSSNVLENQNDAMESVKTLSKIVADSVKKNGKD